MAFKLTQSHKRATFEMMTVASTEVQETSQRKTELLPSLFVRLSNPEGRR